MPRLIALAEYSQQKKLEYNDALRQAIRGDLPAERLGGRWYVRVPEASEPNREAPVNDLP
jgi:hypothetical protein